MSSVNSSSPKFLPYNYVPTEWVCITFLAVFGLSTFLHAVQAIRSRLWWLFPSAVFCGILEVAGWSARLWSSQNPFIKRPFIIQAVALVVAPTPFVAANFILLGRIIRRLGPQYSRLTTTQYSAIFLSCDIIAIFVQGTGGGIAAIAKTKERTDFGTDIALGGTAFQLVAIFVYCALAAEFLVRYTRDRPVRQPFSSLEKVIRGTMDKRLRRMLQAMGTMTILIIIRTIYRLIEFKDGFHGKVISTQWLFDVFDGLMIVLAMYTLNLFHPGTYLRDDYTAVPLSNEP
ncbi:RTA1 domain containing protein [Russula decolorans]